MNDLCKVERRKLIRSGTFNAMTGERKITTTQTVIELCGTPLFGVHERKTGVCNSCFSGWAVEENEPTRRGFAAIATAKENK